MLERNHHIEVSMLPQADTSDLESESDSNNEENESDDEERSNEIHNILSYKQIHAQYLPTQKNLEDDHKYDWEKGEKVYNEIPVNEYLLKESDKKKISSTSPTELFEMFFSSEIKTYIIEASAENGITVSLFDLDIFIGIIILSTFNKRDAIRDYWSTDPLLECPIVRSAMSRNDFWTLKGKMKYSKHSDQDSSDPAWRIRKIFEIFKRNLKRFGYFQTALAVDEMMVKFFGRL